MKAFPNNLVDELGQNIQEDDVIFDGKNYFSKFIKNWTPSNNMRAQGMPRAGEWIGYIERVLILTFVITGNIEAVGFLLAAKSVFRFGDLNKVKEIKITEYVLLGTLASFTIALLIAFTLTLIS